MAQYFCRVFLLRISNLTCRNSTFIRSPLSLKGAHSVPFFFPNTLSTEAQRTAPFLSIQSHFSTRTVTNNRRNTKWAAHTHRWFPHLQIYRKRTAVNNPTNPLKTHKSKPTNGHFTMTIVVLYIRPESLKVICVKDFPSWPAESLKVGPATPARLKGDLNDLQT